MIVSDVIERIEKGEVKILAIQTPSGEDILKNIGFDFIRVMKKHNKVDVDELIELAKLGQQTQWISVNDRLPEKCCSCFIWHISKKFGGACISAHYNSIKKTFGYEERFGGNTTHWMPIPAIPKGDK